MTPLQQDTIIHPPYDVYGFRVTGLILPIQVGERIECPDAGEYVSFSTVDRIEWQFSYVELDEVWHVNIVKHIYLI